MTATELRQKRANLIEQARAILDAARSEERDLTTEEQTNWDRLHTDADSLKTQYERIERQEATDAEMRQSQGAVVGPQMADAETRTEDTSRAETEAFRSWLLHGMAGITPEQRQIMSRRSSALPAEARALAAGIDVAGGFTVPDEMRRSIETAMSAYSGVRKTRATVLPTQGGNDIPMPMSDDTNNSGALLAENVAAGEQDITFGSKMLRAYMYTSRMVRVSHQFMQDTGVANIETWIAERLGERIGRALGAHFITGTGNAQPEGLAAGSTQGRQAAAAAAISYTDLVELEHSLNIAYRENAEFLMSDGALRVIKLLTDGNDRPLWVPGVASREPDRVLGYIYHVDANMPAPASNAISMYFGDFSKFLIRDVSQMQLLRLSERYAEFLQVAFLLFSRHDSCVIDAGTHPIRHMVHP